MTGLLVSVRDAAEAQIALAAGVDVIDIKEPSRGSLGAASSETIRRIVDLVDGRAVISAAWGELLELEPEMPAATIGTDLAKIALAGCADLGDWRARWRRWAKALPPATKPVGVVYADRQIARSPCWEDVLALSADAGAAYLLVDTFDKSAGTLADHWSPTVIAACARAVRAAGLGLVLAGSLSGNAILRAREFSPDFVAVRGAACRGGRTGPLDAAAIASLFELLGRRPGNVLAAASELR